MKQKTHYSEALAYLRDYCLHHGRAMHFSHGDIFEAEGASARLFGYIESGSFHYLVVICNFVPPKFRKLKAPEIGKVK